MKINFTPTTQQLAIIDAVVAGKNVMVISRAGCTKTTTIELCAHALPEEITGIALAFNIKIKDELATRLPKNIEALTMNALGHRAWARATSTRLFLEKNKQFKILEEVLKTHNLTASYEEKGIITNLVNTLRNMGAIPDSMRDRGTPIIPDFNHAIQRAFDFIEEDYNQDTANIATLALIASIHSAYKGTVDFSDQIYMSALFGGQFPKPKILFVDEAQDLSPINHLMIKKCMPKQLVVVGDPMQAIYGFRGAMHDSMEHFAKMYQFEELYLTQTFRCGKAIVEKQKAYVPDFEAAPGNSEGEVIRHIGPWNFSTFNLRSTRKSAILCRNNAPLISMALSLLTARIPATIIGRDIAMGLVKDIKKANPVNNLIGPCLQQLRAFYDAKIEAKESLRNNLEDRYDAIVAAGEGAKDRDTLIELIETLFTDNPISTVTLSTGHKAKGLEWDQVIHLNPFLIPFKGAKGDELVQENNLRYVIETRAKSTLILADAKDWRPE